MKKQLILFLLAAVALFGASTPVLAAEQNTNDDGGYCYEDHRRYENRQGQYRRGPRGGCRGGACWVEDKE